MDMHKGPPLKIMAAMAIEAKVKELAVQTGFAIHSGGWNLGQGMQHAGPHRLDVLVGDQSIRIYFTDHELLAFLRDKEKEATEVRLHRLVSRLRESGSVSIYISPLAKFPRH